MRHLTGILVAAFTTIGACTGASASQCPSSTLGVLVDGVVRPEYHGRSATYVEALRGKEYVLRITNPFGVRVAVALAVDGLNTIDARRSDARAAAKWVLGPHESVDIAGWQVNGAEARSFVFTGEKGSYGAWLGDVANLGVIEAVFFRERPRAEPVVRDRLSGGVGEQRSQAPAPSAAGRPDAKSAETAPLDDELAATGMGNRQRHEVEWVRLELEHDPAVVVRLRYEFREQLVRLGVLGAPSPLDRRERASGFNGRYCPEPPVR